MNADEEQSGAFLLPHPSCASRGAHLAGGAIFRAPSDSERRLQASSGFLARVSARAALHVRHIQRPGSALAVFHLHVGPTTIGPSPPNEPLERAGAILSGEFACWRAGRSAPIR